MTTTIQNRMQDWVADHPWARDYYAGTVDGSELEPDELKWHIEDVTEALQEGYVGFAPIVLGHGLSNNDSLWVIWRIVKP